MYLGHSPTNAGSFIFLDDIASGFNGSETQFTLQVGGVSITPNTQNLLIALDGIIQQAPDAYTTSGSTITFTGAVPSGTDFYGILMGQSASIGQGTIGADELKISGNGTSGQLVKSDGDGTYGYLSTTDITSVGSLTGLTIAGTGTNGAPNLAIDNSSSSSYIHSIEALGANMTAGQTNIINLGKIGDAKNSGVIGYKWNGAGSNDNLLTFEHWGTGALQTIDGLGNVTFLGNGSDQTTKWHSGSAYVNAKLDVRQLAIAFSGTDRVTSDTTGNLTSSQRITANEGFGFDTGGYHFLIHGNITGGTGGYYSTSNTPFGIWTNSTLGFKLDASQNASIYGNLLISNTGSSSYIDIDGNQASGEDGRIYIKGHTSSNSRAYIYFNNGQSSGGQNWFLGALRGSNQFALSTVDDYNTGTNVFAIDSNRKIGINTAPNTASGRLSVSGKIYSDTTSQFSNALIGTVTISSTAYAMLGSNSSSRGIAICRDGASNYADFRVEGNGDINIGSQALVLGTSESGSTERLLRIARFATKATDQIIGELRYTGSSDGGHAFAGIKTYVHHTNGRGRLEFWVNDASAYAERMSLYYDGNLSIDGSLSSSDLTFKKNVKTISSALNTVNSLRGVTYNWKKSTGKDTETKQYGMIAQEVEELLPELVKDYGDKKKKQLNYTAIIPVLVESIKELSAKVTALEGN